MQPATCAPAIVESLEPRRLLAASLNLADQLAFAFPIGLADPAGIATDAQGNFYVAGHFEGTVDFNPARRRHFNLAAVNTGGDPFVAKYSADGRLFWAVQISLASPISGRRDLTANSIDADADGNVYLGGHFERTADFDPGLGVANLTAGANAGGDAYVLALDTNGNFRYANRVPTPGTRGPDDVLNGTGVALATDAAGYVYVTDRVQGQPDLAPDRSNVTVTKFTARGRTLWSRSFADLNAIVIPHAMAVDSDGDVYLAGSVAGTADLDPGAAVHSLGNAEFLLRLTTDGDFAWLGDLGDASAYALTTDAGGNVYAAGGYGNSVDFNFSPRRSFTLTAAGNQDAFVAKYAPNGALAWAHGIGGGGFDGASSIAVAADGTVYAGGQFSARAYFNPGVSRFKLTPKTVSDSFFAAFSPAGVFLNASQIDPLVNVIKTLPGGGLIAGGFLQTSGDVDPSANVRTLNYIGTGQTNLFLLELV